MVNVMTKSVTVRLDKSLVERLDAIALKQSSVNRSFVIDRALTYALDNLTDFAILHYRSKTPGVIQSADLKI